MQTNRKKPRLEDGGPEAIQAFMRAAADIGFRRAVLNNLVDCTIDEETARSLGPDAYREIKLYTEGLEAELGHAILLPSAERLPHLRGHARATYSLRHFDMLLEFPRALLVLERFKVHATRADVTAELAAWAEEQRKDPARRALVERHFNFAATDREN